MALTLDGSSGIASVDGSAGSPSIRGSDANTGVFFSSNVVRISTDGSEIGMFDDNGNFLSNTTSIQAGVSDSTGATQFCVNSTSGGLRITQTDNTFWNCLIKYFLFISLRNLSGENLIKSIIFIFSEGILPLTLSSNSNLGFI